MAQRHDELVDDSPRPAGIDPERAKTRLLVPLHDRSASRRVRRRHRVQALRFAFDTHPDAIRDEPERGVWPRRLFNNGIRCSRWGIGVVCCGRALALIASGRQQDDRDKKQQYRSHSILSRCRKIGIRRANHRRYRLLSYHNLDVSPDSLLRFPLRRWFTR